MPESFKSLSVNRVCEERTRIERPALVGAESRGARRWCVTVGQESAITPLPPAGPPAPGSWLLAPLPPLLSGGLGADNAAPTIPVVSGGAVFSTFVAIEQLCLCLHDARALIALRVGAFLSFSTCVYGSG